MYCHKCGTKAAEADAQFCAKCGTELAVGQIAMPANEDLTVDKIEHNDNETINDSINHSIPSETTTAQQHRASKRIEGQSSLLWPIAIPIISLIIAGGASWGYYSHQKHINQEVVGLKEKAEEVALKGKYKEALLPLKEAQNLRPDYEILNEDKTRIENAIKLNKSLDSISDSLKTQQFDTADKQITSFKDSLKKLEGPLFTPFHKLIDEKSTTLAVAKIKMEINDLSTVEKLAEKLTALSSIQSAEKDEVQKLILAKIVDVSTKGAEAQLTKKQFTDAISTIDKGLEYSSKDTKLLSFKDRIQKEQTAFEKAEEQRLEQAMEVAAQEDLTNRTAAVNVENIYTSLDEYGDIHVTGEVKNTATKPISAITIYYDVYDLDGNFIGSDSTYVSPYYLEVGETGSFDDTYYGVYKDASVQVTQVTWQLN
ncbi:FxLYD domain-containing protein [Neobacillus sp. PS3-34]|uniref:FxLYD domain-containing protein n=1 Tax=Neobacillus sp. PS3-34 TaxID=3070678 RepID=UPI0027DEC411|nr:FxLYD domain-containing protein [Neobacillus sp. PS3-34]WML46706.1 FxLYD domain-containing protein [Neobacillus sp. PS3-34]